MQSTAKQQCLYLLTETSGVLIDGTLKSSIRLKKQNRFVSVRYFYYMHFALLVNKKNSLPPKWRHIYCIGMYPVRAAVGVNQYQPHTPTSCAIADTDADSLMLCIRAYKLIASIGFIPHTWQPHNCRRVSIQNDGF